MSSFAQLKVDASDRQWEYFDRQPIPFGKTTSAAPAQARREASPGRSMVIGIATIEMPLDKQSKTVFVPA
jgi:hypothetical protein